jgi:Xaa-Pro aminopeptidase
MSAADAAATITSAGSRHVAGRADRLRASLDGIDALVVSDLTNVRWLTGFTGSNGYVVLTPQRLTLVTDGRYGAQAVHQMDEALVAGEVLVGLSTAAITSHLDALTAGMETVGFEAAHVSFQQHADWVRAFHTTLRPTNTIVESERRAKDDDEIALIAAACGIADRALAEVAPHLADGLTEAEVRNRLETRMRELGASGPSYDTLVASGPLNSALPHHRPDHRLLLPGDLVIIDVGALLGGYHSDMTRTFVVGEPTAEQAEVYAVVLAAQQRGLDAVGPGVAAKTVDAACRDHIAAHGRGDWFTHGTGHGVGLLIHEDPFVNATSDAVLQVGDVVTVEPGAYREGFGGIRVEDLVVVTSDGCRVLTASAKDSPCLPSPPTT